MPILPTGAVKAGKVVVLTVENPQWPLGRNVTIYRTPGEIGRRFRVRRGKSPLIELDQLAIRANGAEPLRSDPWTLPTPGRRLKWRVLFEDEYLHQSAILHVSRLGMIKPNLGPNIAIPGVPGVQAAFAIEFELQSAIDPVVELSVMTPWGNDDEDLRPYLYELAEDACDKNENPEIAADELRAYLGPHLPADPHAGWEFRVSEPRLELQAGERKTVSVELHAGARGSTAFAVQMVAADNPELATASDLLIIDVPDFAPPSLLAADVSPGDWHTPSESE